nr:ABC transporter ATP-binding protein [Devosia subaequoris]
MFRPLVFFLAPYRWQVVGISTLFLLLSVIDLLGVGLIAPFVAVILNPEALSGEIFGIALPDWLVGGNYGVWLAAGIVMAFVLKGVSGVFVQWMILGFVTRFRARQIKSLMDGYLSQPYQFFLMRNSSTLIQTILVNSKIFSDDLLLPLFRMFAELAVALVLTILLLSIAPLFFLSLIACMVLAGAIYVVVISRQTRQAGQKVTLAQEQLVRGVTQGIGGIKEIRTLGVEVGFSDYVAHAGVRLGVNQRRFYTFSVIPKYLMEMVAVGFVVALVGFYIATNRDPSELLPVIATFAVAGLRLMPAFSQTFSSLNSIGYSRFATDQLYEDLKAFDGGPAPFKTVAERAAPPAGFSQIRLRHVSFTYNGADNEIVPFGPVSLTIPKGSVLGLVGPSGAGKTTLANLVLNLLQPSQGQVEIVQADGQILDAATARSLFAYIPQEQFLLDDTIEKNITLDWSGAPVDTARLQRALDLADFQRVVAKLPEGLTTSSGERGTRLSGGERQRLSIARALYHNRQVLVMDEVTSALDEETERGIVASFERLRNEGLTLIMIAHRHSTLRICDSIVRMENGQIVQQGSFEAVLGAAGPAPQLEEPNP